MTDATARRAQAGALLVVSIMLGLGTRRFGDALPEVVARYGGDVLWAVALYWLLTLAWPTARPWLLGLATFGISALVEVSQLFHAPWIDAVRANRLGALVLGQGFVWSDFVCYALGAGVALGVDTWITSRRSNS